LCASDARIVESHIVPEFLYEPLYDEKHRFFEISLDPGQRDKIKQKGLREPLLCELCEQRLSVFEGYARQLFRGGIQITVIADGEHLRLSGIDYPKLKLFQISILWRAGVSRLPAFAQVDLGPHEPRLRQMLSLGDPGPASEYGCVMSAAMHGRELLQGLVVPPTHATVDGQKAYRFVFGGLIFVYLVSSSQPPQVLTPAFAQPDGTALLRKQQVTEMKYLMSAFQELSQQGKLAAGDK
jgi:hypothetical protein